MGEIMKSDGGGIISLLRGKDGSISIPVPFERDIYLFDTHIAGTSFIENIGELEAGLNEGDRLGFFREPDNPHDSRAIVVKNADGAKVGYVPRADNAVFSRLMDAGKLLFGRIESKRMRGNWLRIDIKIFLHE